MTLKELRDKRAKLLAEIDGADEKRFAQIQVEVSKVNFQIGALEEEERAATANEEAAEMRAAMRPASPNAGEGAGAAGADPAMRMAFGANQSAQGANANTAESRAAADIAGMSKRDKIAFMMGKQARKKELTEVEKRALGSALTTTATTFVQATETENGVNNAGVFIATRPLLEFLREEGLISPIVADIAMTHVAGLTSFPYRKDRDKARPKAEGAKGKDNQMEWATLTGTKGYLQTIMVVTDEIRALTDFDFGSYLMDQMLQDLNEDWSEELIYGDGSTDRVKGLAPSAIQKTYTGSALDTIVAGVKLCKGKFRRGAKVYVAQDVYDNTLFAVDKDGKYINPIINNTTGVKSVGKLRVEMDEGLNDGDIIIGNVTRFFKVNVLIPLRIETDRNARAAKTEYIASVFVATAAFPDAILYYKKNGGTSGNGSIGG